MNRIFKFGKYRHYKGKEYIAMGTAVHSEDLSPMVLYAPLYNDSGLWVRPEPIFTEDVTIDGKTQPRFLYLGEASAGELEKIKPYFYGMS